jgi:hypothetical protein
VGAIAHYLEDEGVPTTSISLVRENTVASRPPRALWVSFELGRPFGVPGDADFQRAVLRGALNLLTRNDGPVILEDYPIDVPDRVSDDGMEGLVCPINLPRPEITTDSEFVRSILSETGPLAPWYQLALEQHGRTSVGISGLDIEDAVRFLADLVENGTAPPGNDDRSLGERMRAATEDVRSWYLEAAGARPGGAASSRALADWFWGETAAGALFLRLDPVCRESDDASLREAGKSYLVPRAQRHRLSAS